MTNLMWKDLSDAGTFVMLASAGFFAGYAIRSLFGRWQANSTERRALEKLEQTDIEIKNKLKEAEISARDVTLRSREEFEASTKERRDDLLKLSTRLDEKSNFLNKKDEALTERLSKIKEREQELTLSERAANEKSNQADQLLQRLSNVTVDDARRILYQRAENETRNETGLMIRRIQEEAQANAKKEAQRIVTTAIQRYALPQASEQMTSTIAITEEEIKGRIVGREGRNIRTLETLTGVSLMLDEAPDVIVVSGFNPIRRAIACKALEILIADGKIHVGSIEEAVKQAERSMNETMLQAAEAACEEAGVQGLSTIILQTLGKLKYRTSFSQNVLQHAIEVANLMGMMAGDLDLNPTIARRVGLLHDLGKAIDQEKDGSHAALGAELLKQAGEYETVVNAVAAHHGEVEAKSLYAALCQAADAISSARPGARSGSTHLYVKRLADLEAIATSFTGVHKAYAIQAGRELRVIVAPDLISDNDAMLLARDIARKIQANMQYPGQIRVTVARETRFVEFAK